MIVTAAPPIPVAARATHNAATCVWATPTLFLSAPFWLEADDCPWACARDAMPRVLMTTDECAICSHWAPRPTCVPADDACGATHQQIVPPMVDWFGFPPPHEAE